MNANEHEFLRVSNARKLSRAPKVLTVRNAEDAKVRRKNMVFGPLFSDQLTGPDSGESVQEQIYHEILSGVIENSFEIIFVDHRRYRPLAFFFAAANDPSAAIDEYVGIGAEHSGRQNDTEADGGVDGQFAVHVEQNAAG